MRRVFLSLFVALVGAALAAFWFNVTTDEIIRDGARGSSTVLRNRFFELRADQFDFDFTVVAAVIGAAVANLVLWVCIEVASRVRDRRDSVQRPAP